MKNRISAAELNVSQAALLSGKTRETVSRAARELQSVNGAGNAKFFDSRKLLQALYLGTAGPTYSEAQRLLALARTDQVRLQNDVMQDKFYPRDQVHFLYEHVFRIVTSTLKGNVNRLLTFETVNDIFRQFREAGQNMLKEAGELQNAYEEEETQKANGSGVAPGGLCSDRQGIA